MNDYLGFVGSITIAKAREAARAKLGEVAKGNNPRAERLQKAQQAEQLRRDRAFTLRTLIGLWSTLHLADRSPHYREEAVRAVSSAFAVFLDEPASCLTRLDVVAILDRIQQSDKKAMAVRTASYARAAFQWAAKREQIETNPFVSLPASAAIKARDRVLTDDELCVVLEATKALPGGTVPSAGFADTPTTRGGRGHPLDRTRSNSTFAFLLRATNRRSDARIKTEHFDSRCQKLKNLIAETSVSYSVPSGDFPILPGLRSTAPAPPQTLGASASGR